MKRIDRIIVVCCERDFWLTRICVASIRHWYPDMPVGLIKDVSLGDFDTRELESHWDVSVVAVPDPPRGPFTKFEAFHLPGRERILLLDSDTVFLGRFLEILEEHEEDFVVNWGGTEPLPVETRRKYALDGYYHPEKLQAMVPDFEIPDYFFNTGHMVVTTSVLPRERVAGWLAGHPPKESVCCPGVLLKYDQGLLNVLLVQMRRRGECTLGLCDFVRWSIHREMVWDIELERIRARRGYPGLLHWAELKTSHKTGFIRGDLLGFYEDLYYSRIPDGEWKRNFRLLRRVRRQAPLRVRKIMEMTNKSMDFRELLRLEARPSKEANPYAFIR